MFGVMDTSRLPKSLRIYLPLLLETLMESPIKRGDELISHEEVVAQLEADTIATSTRLGIESPDCFTCGPFNYSAILMLQV